MSYLGHPLASASRQVSLEQSLPLHAMAMNFLCEVTNTLDLLSFVKLSPIEKRIYRH